MTTTAKEELMRRVVEDETTELTYEEFKIIEPEAAALWLRFDVQRPTTWVFNWQSWGGVTRDRWIAIPPEELQWHEGVVAAHVNKDIGYSDSDVPEWHTGDLSWEWEYH